MNSPIQVPQEGNGRTRNQCHPIKIEQHLRWLSSNNKLYEFITNRIEFWAVDDSRHPKANNTCFVLSIELQ